MAKEPEAQPEAQPEALAPFQPLVGAWPEDETQRLHARIAELESQAAGTPAGLISQARAAFAVPAGEEGYVHALVTHKNGVAVDHPRVEPFHPAVYRSLAKTEGFTAEVLHDPATAQAVPTNGVA